MPEKTRFVILSQGRTGSLLLVEMLESHPEIHCEHEVLNSYGKGRFSRRILFPIWRRFPDPLLSYKAARCNHAAYGLKVSIGHCVNMPAVIHRLHRKGWRMMKLERRDKIAQALSSVVAQSSHRWHRTEDEMAGIQKVVVQPDVFLAWIGEYLRGAAEMEQSLQGIPYCDVTYEDDLVNAEARRAASVRLLNYLEVPMAPLTTRLVKTWDRPYAEVIENYGELMDAIAQSEYRDRLPAFLAAQAAVTVTV